MNRLLVFIYKIRIFAYFLLLEVTAIWLILNTNNYYNASYFNTSSAWNGFISEQVDRAVRFKKLHEINQELAEENALLRRELSFQNLKIEEQGSVKLDMEVVPARVINNQLARSENYFIIDKGIIAGIRQGMGVITENGIAGIVKDVSANYSTVTSMLHKNLIVSSRHKNSQTLCSVQWDALSPLYSQIQYIPSHIDLSIGDSIVTSGFNAVFPPEILIGVISSIEPNSGDSFHKAHLKLNTDFYSMSYVYVVSYAHKDELDKMEEQINE